ncbi:hypothetical protein ABRY23_09670 [Melioribacteraceae bacterium 4301-Me]|uniref:hypothetical protein n=1 Tax=Pyranulibacter aquaticus TaxID=3163344 RepID=UPI0035995D9E
MKYLTAVYFLIVLFVTNEINALPRFALRQKDNCVSCHYNPTGGLIRNEDGFFFGKNVISMISPRDKDFTLNPKLTENIQIGLDYRTQLLYTYSLKKADFQDMSGNFYVNVGLSDKINVTTRYDFVQAIWEAYVTAFVLPNKSYIKAGTFTPDYGIRLDDHTAYTRGGDFALITPGRAPNGLIYSPYYTETGIEIGANFSNAVSLTASVGRNKQYPMFLNDPVITTKLQITPNFDSKLGIMFGGSLTSFTSKPTGTKLRSLMYGGFAGAGYERFSILGEFDLAEDYQASDVTTSAIMIEASYKIMVGLEAVVRYDKFDPNINFSNDEFSHIILGFDFYPYSFIELIPQYRIYTEHPSIDNNSFLLQFHFWY